VASNGQVPCRLAGASGEVNAARGASERVDFWVSSRGRLQLEAPWIQPSLVHVRRLRAGKDGWARAVDFT
jgi:hypothetical protein